MIKVEFFPSFYIKNQNFLRFSNYSTIIPLFLFYSRAKNYSKTPQNGIEITPFGDPGIVS
jgi:hypothetical protein